MKKTISLCLAVAMLLMSVTFLSSCSDKPSDFDTDWAICWYLCGSDLESGGGCATADLNEMMKVELPENVKIVIETGGSSEWQNDFVDAGKLQRFVYSSDGLELVDEHESANMGDPGTLQAFLQYAKENYPADKTAVLFWNHGGGSVSGAAFDELYQSDSLTIEEMHTAFDNAFGTDGANPPLEMVGFDTCLMATIDVAAAFSDVSRYLVASEETEPGNGWYYSEWLSALAADTAMDGAMLGKKICDAYYHGCELVGTQDNTTLSVTDLTKLDGLLSAYETFGKEALTVACADQAFFSNFGRIASKSENYGGNTKEQGYTNMIDLGHLARESAEILKSSSGCWISSENV